MTDVMSPATRTYPLIYVSEVERGRFCVTLPDNIGTGGGWITRHGARDRWVLLDITTDEILSDYAASVPKLLAALADRYACRVVYENENTWRTASYEPTHKRD